MSDLIAINWTVVVTANDGSGEPNVIDIQLKTVVLQRPTSLQTAAGSSADSSRVSLSVIIRFLVCIYNSGRFTRIVDREGPPSALLGAWRSHGHAVEKYV